jgi:hypothetical protein
MVKVDRTICLHLARRADRLERFRAGLPIGFPFPTPQLYDAVDGFLLPKPASFTEGKGGWGCFRSYLRLFEDAMRYSWGTVAVFEDDCAFRPDFSPRVLDFLDRVPEDWDLIYLGGLFRRGPDDNMPHLVAPGIMRAYYLFGTWAVIYNPKTLPLLYQGILDEPRPMVCDVTMARVAAKHKLNIYVPAPWLCGQREGHSDISFNTFPKELWVEWNERDWRTDTVNLQLIEGMEAFAMHHIHAEDRGQWLSSGPIPPEPAGGWKPVDADGNIIEEQ